MQLLSFLRVQKAHTVTTVKTWLYLKICNTYIISQLGEKMTLSPEFSGPKHSSTGSIQEAPAQLYPLAKAVSYDFSMIISLCLTHSEDLTHSKLWNNKWPKSHRTWRSTCCQKRQFYFHFSCAGKTQATKNGQLEFVKAVSSCCNEILTAKTRTVGYFGIVWFCF